MLCCFEAVSSHPPALSCLSLKSSQPSVQELSPWKLEPSFPWRKSHRDWNFPGSKGDCGSGFKPSTIPGLGCPTWQPPATWALELGIGSSQTRCGFFKKDTLDFQEIKKKFCALKIPLIIFTLINFLCFCF
jgi:hypothetical protein